MYGRNDFSSIDRLVELGMGLAMSNQIAQSMNNMMGQLNTPPQVYPYGRAYVQPQPLMPQNAPVQQVSSQAQSQPVSQTQTQPAQNVVPELYYAVINGKQLGPYKGTEIALLILGRKILAQTLVWKTGTKEWVKAESYEDLKNLIDMVPPEIKDDGTKTAENSNGGQK